MIQRQESCADGEGCGPSYAVGWIAESASRAQFVCPDEANIEEFITYDVTVSYKEKSQSHGGLIGYYGSKSAERKFVIYDGIVPQINTAALDKLPVARATKVRNVGVFRKSEAKEEAARLEAATIDGRKLESEDGGNPIGYLPGDDESFVYVGRFAAMLVPCPPPCTLTIAHPVYGQIFSTSDNTYRIATVPLRADSACSGTVSWTAQFGYSTSGNRGPFSASQTASSTVGQTINLQTQSDGGEVTISAQATLNGSVVTSSIKAYVVGTSIPDATITDRLVSLYSGGARPRLLTGIAAKESTYRQFQNILLYGSSELLTYQAIS